MRRLLLLTAALWISGAQGAEVAIEKFAFTPQSLTVVAGTTITWRNHDEEPHTVTAKSLKFRSEALDTNESFTVTFDQPGSFAYFCAIHPQMKGTIMVLPKTP